MKKLRNSMLKKSDQYSCVVGISGRLRMNEYRGRLAHRTCTPYFQQARPAVQLILVVLFLFAHHIAFAQQATSIRGFSAANSAKQQELEIQFQKSISPRRIEEDLRWLTSRPHRAGTEGARITAEQLHRYLQEFGFQTETVLYDAYLSDPVSVSVEMTEPVQESLPTTEDRIEGDPFTEQVGLHPGWNAYSGSGEAVGEVVYANHGSVDDMRMLQEMGVDLRGKILLMRYFGAGEGRKVHNAEIHGAVGVILYSDPAEDGFHFGNVYPEGNWRPGGSIMRRSIGFLPYEGDPLSPGWASVPGARRLKPEDVPHHSIPVLPVSYRTAERILNFLGGEVAPFDWQGDLGLTYHVGPGPAKVRIRTEMDQRDRQILNVVGRIPGAEDPDQWVILSNHHDAWIFGAGDPSSGTAALLEQARVIGDLVRKGFRPRRTLIVAFWDAEEMLLGGSTEWAEQHSAELLGKAIAVINMDSAVFNTDRPLSVSAHPALHRLFREASREVRDPKTGQSIFEAWRDLQNRFRNVPGVDGWGEFFDPDQELSEPYIFEVPYDDASPFFQYLALPASDMYYGADYGMYHSIYENFHWMKTVVDPSFEYHAVMAQIQGIVGLRLLNADLLPLDYATEAGYWRRAYGMLDETARAGNQKVPRLQEALDLINEWEREAQGLVEDCSAFLSDPRSIVKSEGKLAALNERIYRAARDFYRSEGRPDNSLERNLFVGSSYEFAGVSGSTLPGIRFNLDQGKLPEAEAEAALYTDALKRRVATLKSIRKEIGRLR